MDIDANFLNLSNFRVDITFCNANLIKAADDKKAIGRRIKWAPYWRAFCQRFGKNFHCCIIETIRRVLWIAASK